MKEREGSGWGSDISNEFFEDVERIECGVGLVADVDYCIDYANDWAQRKRDFEDEDGEERMVDVTVISQIRRIRELTGLSMNKFAAKYHIPARTLQDWEYGKAEPAEYLVDLLERAVREDYGLPCWYEVTATVRGDEFVQFRTYSRADAIAACIDEWRRLSPYDKAHQTLEVRIYDSKDWVELEQYDHDLLEW